MKFIMSKGMFVCRENDDQLNTLTGKITGIRVIAPEDAPEKLQIDFTETLENEQSTVRTLSLKKYGDASLKILRCLFGIAEIMHNKTVSIELEAREGRSALIKVSADGEQLAPLGSDSGYNIDRNLIIDKALVVLKACLEFGADFLIIRNDDGFYPTDESGDLDEMAIAGYVTDLRRTGRQGELKIVKTGFTSLAGANAYKKALTDIGGVHYTTNPHKVAVIWDAYAGPLPEEAPASLGTGNPLDEEV